jgi:hypothetical protein
MARLMCERAQQRSKQSNADEKSWSEDDYINDLEGRHKMRSNDHETRFCSSIGGGLHRRIDAWLCPRRAWAWRRVCERWRLRAQSHDSPGITNAANARF